MVLASGDFLGVAGGVDSTSNVPLVLGEKLRNVLLDANRAKTTGAKIREFLKLRPRDFNPVTPGINEPRTGMPMGGHTEITAKYYHISRQDQDKLAFESHEKMARAYDEGFFSDMITPYLGLTQDNNLRRDTTPDQVRFLVKALRELLISHALIDPNSVRVRFIAIGAWSLDLEIVAYVKTTDFDEFLVFQEELLLSILDVVRQAGTALAVPAQINLLSRDPLSSVARRRIHESPAEA